MFSFLNNKTSRPSIEDNFKKARDGTLAIHEAYKEMLMRVFYEMGQLHEKMERKDKIDSNSLNKIIAEVHGLESLKESLESSIKLLQETINLDIFDGQIEDPKNAYKQIVALGNMMIEVQKEERCLTSQEISLKQKVSRIIIELIDDEYCLEFGDTEHDESLCQQKHKKKE